MSRRDIYLSPKGDPTMYILTHKQSKGIRTKCPSKLGAVQVSCDRLRGGGGVSQMITFYHNNKVCLILSIESLVCNFSKNSTPCCLWVGETYIWAPKGDPTMYILTHKQSKGISSITEYEKLSILRNWHNKTLAVNSFKYRTIICHPS